MATIKEIAKAAGVSIGTVDRVLHNRGMVNAQTKERIERVMKELDYRPNHVAQGLAVRKKKLKIGFFIPETKGHPFFAKVRMAAEQKARELEQYGVCVAFFDLDTTGRVIAPPGLDVKAASEEQDGYVMLGLDTPLVRNFLKKSERRRKPVMFYNACVPEAEYIGYIGCNYEDSGRLAAGLAALAGGDDARVCIFSEGGDSPIESYRERLRGFCEEVRTRYPAMRILDVRAIGEGQKENETAVRQLFLDFPDVNLIYVINPADYGICREIARADKARQVRIITNDLVAEQEELMRAGVISATICQEPEKQGELSLELLFRYLAYGTLPEKKTYYTNLSIHIAQNS